MRKLSKIVLIFFNLVAVWAVAQVVPADNDAIRVSASVQPLEVPLNRTAVVTVQLEWAGDLDRFEIRRIDNPLLENADIAGTASSNQVQVVDNMPIARQSYQFTIKPEALGMAYVDGIIILYTDAETGKEYRLHTTRLELKIIDPVAEPGSYLWILWLAAGLLIVAGAGVVIQRWRNRKAEALRIERERLAADVPAEQKYLEQLRSEIKLNSSDLDVNESFNRLSRLVRHFLAEKYQVSIMGTTTAQVRAMLVEAGADDHLIMEAMAILEMADLAKFSGAWQERNELDRAYTTFESWLSKSAAVQGNDHEKESTT